MSQARHFIAAETASPPFFVGIDLGGTYIKFGVVDDLGRPLSWLSIPTEVQRGPEDAARRMGAAVREAIAKAGLQPQAVARVGFGSAGPMDLPAGIIISPVNLVGWDHFPIRDRVSHHCGMPVTFENDANAAAYGEFWVGAGRGLGSLVLLTLGTGIGVGIILDDVVIRGEHSHGGESGHIIIDCREEARLCGCGRRGHLEAYASATAVTKRTGNCSTPGGPVRSRGEWPTGPNSRQNWSPTRPPPATNSPCRSSRRRPTTSPSARSA